MGKCKNIEGGFLAWAVVVASFMIHVLQSGFSDSFGLILPSIRTTFHASNAEASLTNSIVVFLTLGSSPVAAGIIKMVGHKLTMIAGVVIASAGLTAGGLYIKLGSDYAAPLVNRTDNQTLSGEDVAHPNILVLYASVGIMAGVGFGFTYLPSVDILKMHFDKNLGLACGIAASGTGFGQFVMAPVVNTLQEHFGLSGTLFGFAVIFGASIFFCFLFKSPSSTKEISEEEISPPGNMFKDISKRFSELKSPSKIFLIVHAFLLNICIYSIFTFYAERAISFGISESDTSYLLSMMGFANFVARITFGIIIDKFRSKAFLILTSVHIINGLSMISSQFIKNFTGQAIAAVIFGAGFGAKVTCFVVIVGIIVEDITFLLSICYFVIGLASLIGPTFVGYLLDVSGTYLPGFMVVGIIFILGALCLPLVWWNLEKERRN